MPIDDKALAAECLAAVTGLYPSSRILRGQVADAIAMPKRLMREVSAFFDQDESSEPAKSEKINYLATWERLNAGIPDDDKIEILEDAELGSLYLQLLQTGREYLQGQWRPTKITLLTGPKLLAPSTSEKARCQDLYAMVNDPTRILNRLNSCCVMAEEMAALNAVFPNFIMMLSDMINGEIYRRVQARKSYEVPYRQSIAIKMFAGESTADETETINAETQPAEQSAPPEFDIATKKRDSMTHADRITEGNASGE
jgi:hypothetical protein